mmetsp:Transcript_63428/g.159968  ORF Transcript_63428/g.159968 Transcript_63428/m.159968 type:complete len:210 (+) Transcript_63428:1874-2503(+)
MPPREVRVGVLHRNEHRVEGNHAHDEDLEVVAQRPREVRGIQEAQELEDPEETSHRTYHEGAVDEGVPGENLDEAPNNDCQVDPIPPCRFDGPEQELLLESYRPEDLLDGVEKQKRVERRGLREVRITLRELGCRADEVQQEHCQGKGLVRLRVHEVRPLRPRGKGLRLSLQAVQLRLDAVDFLLEVANFGGQALLPLRPEPAEILQLF